MSLIKKKCEKAVYVVILFLFLIKPAADQAPLVMSTSEWIFIQCRKAEKLTRAEILMGFQKTVVFLCWCSQQPAAQHASSQDLAGSLFAWTDLRGVGLPEPLGALQQRCTGTTGTSSMCIRCRDDFTIYINAEHSTARGHPHFLKLQEKWHQGTVCSQLPAVPECQFVLNGDSSGSWSLQGSAPKDEFNPGLPPQWSSLRLSCIKK